MAFRTTDFDGVICAGNIEPSKCLMEYITGAGQFYVENPFYVQSSIRAGKKLPFVDVEYSGKQGSGQAIHPPSIFYHHSNGQYYSPSRYNILWKTAELGAAKVIRFKAPYGGVDEQGRPTKLQESKSKIRTVSIGIVSRSKWGFKDDVAMSVITFHLTEVLSILSYAYSFDIDLSAAKYKSCKDNVSFYTMFAEDINAKLSAAGVTKVKLEIDEDSIAQFNEPVAYIQDPDCFEDIKPTIPAMKVEDSYVPLWTLQRGINAFYIEARKNRIDASKYISIANRVSFMNKIAMVNYAGNKAQLKMVKNDDDADYKEFFIIKSDFTFLNTDKEEDREKCKGLCTCVFADDEFVPIGSEEELMTYYNALMRGEIYLSFEYKISLFAKSAYGLHVKTAMFDCVKEQSSVGTMSAATRLAKERRERERKVAAIAATTTVEAENDDDLDVTLSE